MRNIVDYIREVLFRKVYAVVDNYEKTFNPEPLPSGPAGPATAHGLNRTTPPYVWHLITLLLKRRSLLSLGHSPMLLLVLKRV